MPKQTLQNSLIECSASYTVRCYQINAKSIATANGTFDDKAMMLTVRYHKPSPVSVNPRYGDGTRYGEYYYKSANGYFFDPK